jgi:hypothetical protein
MKDYKYTTDWNVMARITWDEILKDYKNKPNLHFLEVGCWEGRTTNWLLHNILTHTSSKITVVDSFKGSPEETGMQHLDLNTIKERFQWNTTYHSDKIKILEGHSNEVLKKLENKPQFDFAFIDGSHTAWGTLEDAILIHPLLKQGGIIIFDDYQWKDLNLPSATDSPQLGIDCFLKTFGYFYDVINMDWQVTIKKKYY